MTTSIGRVEPQAGSRCVAGASEHHQHRQHGTHEPTALLYDYLLLSFHARGSAAVRLNLTPSDRPATNTLT